MLLALLLAACAPDPAAVVGLDPELVTKRAGKDRPVKRKRRRLHDDDDGGVIVGANPATPHRRLDALGPGEPALVVLVVLDTVRADHTSACGYARPTTPRLAALVATADAFTCDAYAPAPWTIPSHASYLTGLRTSEHGVHALGAPLPDSVETLAERYAARGYQTAFVSANPVFRERGGGFWQGFEQIVVAEAMKGPLRDDLGPWLARVLDATDPGSPLLLVVNLFDAHDPYPAVPEGHPWLPAQERVAFHPHRQVDDNPYWRFVQGRMPESERADFLRRVIDGYDGGVARADANLGLVLDALAGRGWLDRPHRLAVTSDHGEHLGEHGLLRHGAATWQPVIRVPLLWRDTTSAASVPIAGPVSATTVFALLDTGATPTPPLPVEAVSVRNPDDGRPSWDMLALLPAADTKLVDVDGAPSRYALASDPGEAHALPVTPDEAARLAEAVRAHRASRATEAALDPALTEVLREVGYVE